VRRLLAADPTLVMSVSATTRAPRPSEREGVDYFFVSDPVFDRMIADGELLEWVRFAGHRSGTPARSVEERSAEGVDVVLVIDVEGARRIRDLRRDALLIFVEPPNVAELERRLRARGTETEDAIEQRLEIASREMGQREWFDYVVVNDDLERAAAEVAAIIEGSRTP